MTKKYDVVGIGNAIVDVISQSDDQFLANMGISKGIMQLVERERAELLYAAMQNRVQAPGGSVGNTLAGIGSLGLSTAFVGRVKNDPLGQFYEEQMIEEGTAFPNPPTDDDANPTSRSMIFVSPDGERSMNTYLGAGAEFSDDDVDPAVMEEARFLFLEGYLFDKDKGKSAFRAAAAACRHAGGQAGLSLSDPFCVDRHRESFKQLIEDEMDFVIGNEHEWKSLYETDDLATAMQEVAMVCPLVVCTRSGDPVVIRADDQEIHVPVKETTPVDATGAGDQFAAGFIYGLASGKDLETSGKMGVAAASEVIGHIGPRPKRPLKVVFAEQGLS
ncbi:adenosine kinase [Actibacterium pelagium]|uniref:Adenosine kinase n=1 Tax=Actibacterium pelagium TaxID=2029103 RepID=A0A917AIB4_9RHOB|nr:adenosine kinase [Actibacterium pelagium]GGE54254.1 adenosine kinase [Actibacterium pelagium]